MQMFGGGSPPIVFNPAIFKAVYKEFPIPRPGDPPPFLVELTFPSNPALTGQPVSLLRNGQVIGKAIAGDGSVNVAADVQRRRAAAPGELEIAIDAEGAAPGADPGVGRDDPAATAATAAAASGAHAGVRHALDVQLPDGLRPHGQRHAGERAGGFDGDDVLHAAAVFRNGLAAVAAAPAGHTRRPTRRATGPLPTMALRTRGIAATGRSRPATPERRGTRRPPRRHARSRFSPRSQAREGSKPDPGYGGDRAGRTPRPAPAAGGVGPRPEVVSACRGRGR